MGGRVFLPWSSPPGLGNSFPTFPEEIYICSAWKKIKRFWHFLACKAKRELENGVWLSSPHLPALFKAWAQPAPSLIPGHAARARALHLEITTAEIFPFTGAFTTHHVSPLDPGKLYCEIFTVYILTRLIKLLWKLHFVPLLCSSQIHCNWKYFLQ